MLFRGHQYEHRNDFGCCTNSVFAGWGRLVLGPRSRLTRSHSNLVTQPYPNTDSRLRGRTRVPVGSVNCSFNREGPYESVRHSLRLLAQAVQLPHHRARQTTSHYFSGFSDWNLRCLSRLRPGVPVRLVADEKARVQAPQRVGGRARHDRYRSQGGLRSHVRPVARRSFAYGPESSLLFPEWESEARSLYSSILKHNDKENTDEHKHRE